MKKRWVSLFLLVILSVGVSSYGAQEEGSLFKRKILALYKGSEEMSEEQNDIWAIAEFPLNYLGLTLDYVDIEKGFPDDQMMSKYRGVLTLFYSNEMPHAKEYCNWVRRQVMAGRKYVILESFGAFVDSLTGVSIDALEINRVFHALGLDFGYHYTEDKAKIALIEKDPRMVEFEWPIGEDELGYYFKIASIHPENKVFLKIRRRDIPQSESDMVVLSPFGGLAYGPYVYHEDPETNKWYWHLNPYEFFAEAFDVQKTPRMDLSILNGNRIFFSHIDGDGFSNLSLLEPQKLCSEIVTEKIFNTYNLPFSVSVIAGEIDPRGLGNDRLVKIAQEMFASSNIEAASHSYAHPHIWKEGVVDLKIPGYSFDLNKEIKGSIEFINSTLLAGDKKVKVFFWTGDCSPSEEALTILREEKVGNFNHPLETGFDHKMFPSHINLTPAVCHVGKELKFSNRSSNDYIYTHGWKGPKDGLKNVLATFINTDKEETLLPINVYYHFYSGENKQAFNALNKIYHWCLTQKTAPMWVSEYIETVRGFLQSEIIKENEDVWEVSNNGFCRTVRFDKTNKYPDLKESGNILGFTHRHGNLYVYCDDNDEHRIVLTSSSPKEIYLKNASCLVDRWKVSDDVITFKAKGWVGQFTLANLKPFHYYKIDNPSAKETVFSMADSKGNLDFDITLQGQRRVTVALSDQKMFFLEKVKRLSVFVFGIIYIIVFVVLARRRAKTMD